MSNTVLYFISVIAVWVLSIGALLAFEQRRYVDPQSFRESAVLITIGSLVWPPVLGAMLFIGTMAGLIKGTEWCMLKASRSLKRRRAGKADKGTPPTKCRCIGGSDPCPLPPQEGVHR